MRDGGGFCYFTEELVHSIRSEVIGKLDGDRRITTVGLRDMTPLCPLLQLELHRKFPNFSQCPEPRVCDYGYEVDARGFVERGLQTRSLKWVVVFLRPDSPRMQRESDAVTSLLDKVNGRKLPFHIKGVEYDGVIHQILDY